MEPLRLLSLLVHLALVVSCIIIFGTLSDKGKYYGHSVFNDNKNALHFGIAVGVLGFITAFVFSIFDALTAMNKLPLSEGLYTMIDMCGSAFNALLSFVGFCFLTDEWRKTDGKSALPSSQKNSAQAAIAFLFFATVLWMTSIIAAYKFRRDGGSSGSSSDRHQDDPSQYASFVDDYK